MNSTLFEMFLQKKRMKKGAESRPTWRKMISLVEHIESRGGSSCYNLQHTLSDRDTEYTLWAMLNYRLIDSAIDFIKSSEGQHLIAEIEIPLENEKAVYLQVGLGRDSTYWGRIYGKGLRGQTIFSFDVGW